MKKNYEPYQNPGQKFKQAKNDLQKMSEFWVKTEINSEQKMTIWRWNNNQKLNDQNIGEPHNMGEPNIW